MEDPHITPRLLITKYWKWFSPKDKPDHITPYWKRLFTYEIMSKLFCIASICHCSNPRSLFLTFLTYTESKMGVSYLQAPMLQKVFQEPRCSPSCGFVISCKWLLRLPQISIVMETSSALRRLLRARPRMVQITSTHIVTVRTLSHDLT